MKKKTVIVVVAFGMSVGGMNLSAAIAQVAEQAIPIQNVKTCDKVVGSNQNHHKVFLGSKLLTVEPQIDEKCIGGPPRIKIIVGEAEVLPD